MELSTQREKSAHTAPSITSLCRCAEAVLYAGAEELLMPNDMRWCPVDVPFIAPTVSSAQINVSAGTASKSGLDDILDMYAGRRGVTHCQNHMAVFNQRALHPTQ